MAKVLTFEGHSDDIFIAGGDEFYGDAVAVTAGSASLIVRAFYGHGDHNKGVWCIGIEPSDEDSPMPDWPASFDLSKNGYSARLSLTVPDDAKVTHTPEASS